MKKLDDKSQNVVLFSDELRLVRLETGNVLSETLS
jgi:hypothetical protein